MWISIIQLNISSPENVVLPRISSFFLAQEFSNISLHKYNQKMQHKNLLFIQEFSNWQFKHVQLLRCTGNNRNMNFELIQKYFTIYFWRVIKWYPNFVDYWKNLCMIIVFPDESLINCLNCVNISYYPN